MTPTKFRSSDTDELLRFAIGDCSLGSLLVAATEQGICAILLGDDPSGLVRELQDSFPKAQLRAYPNNPEARKAMRAQAKWRNPR